MVENSNSRITNLLAKYLAQFERNPKSAVFAPLAECYRKLGMKKEAFTILKKGLRYHPHYLLALLVLGNCYFDEGNFEECYRILLPLSTQNFDNLKLQKLFADVCYRTYRYKDALQSYKNVLYLNPKDEVAAKVVIELENDERNVYAYLNKDSMALNELDNSFDEIYSKNKKLQTSSIQSDPDSWLSMDSFAHRGLSVKKNISPVESEDLKDLEDSDTEEIDLKNMEKVLFQQSHDDWSMKSWSEKKGSNFNLEDAFSSSNDGLDDAGIFEQEVFSDLSNMSKKSKTSILDEEINEEMEESLPELDEDEKPTSVYPSEEKLNLDSFNDWIPGEEVPIVTHTLIDLYCSQKHYEKAIDLLKKIIAQNPKDIRSQEKLQKILKDSGTEALSIVPTNVSRPVVKKNPMKETETLIKKTPVATPNITNTNNSHWDNARYQLLAQKYKLFIDTLKSS